MFATLAPTAPMAEKLAASAFTLFADAGINEVNLDEVAAHAGVTKGSVYHHFKSKKEVILAACDHYYGSWTARIREEMALLSDPVDQLEAVLAFSVRSCVADRKNRVFTAEIFALSLKDADIRESWAGFYDRARRIYIDLLARAPAAAKRTSAEIRTRVNLMLATMEGIKQRASFEPEIAAPRLQRETVASLMGILGL
ncbi:MAG: TetR/AcrR family transcriptional regulator [Kiritimatiellia bacterium]